MYDSRNGVWISEDPIQADQINTYRFVGNNPTNLTDPTGLFAIGHHRKLVESGIAANGYKLRDGWYESPTLKVLGDYNIGTDALKTIIGESEGYHAQNQYFGYVVAEHMRIITAARAGDSSDAEVVETVLTAMARASHNLQDFYSHSDWVDGRDLVPIYEKVKKLSEVEKDRTLVKTLDSLIERGASHKPIAGTLDLNKLRVGDLSELSDVIFFNGGNERKVVDLHNLLAADDDGSEATVFYAPIQGRNRFLARSFTRAFDAARQQTVEFFKWAHDAMDDKVRCLVFEEDE